MCSSDRVAAGEIVGLLGPNGAGKTTMFNMVVGLVRPDEGGVLVLEEEISHRPMHLRARAGIGYPTQEPSVFRKLTGAENTLAVLETCETGESGAVLGLAGSPEIAREGTDFAVFFPEEGRYRMIRQPMNSEGTAQNSYPHH